MCSDSSSGPIGFKIGELKQEMEVVNTDPRADLSTSLKSHNQKQSSGESVPCGSEIYRNQVAGV